MFLECRDYLISKLREAGVKGNPITSMKRLKICQDSRVAAVLPAGDAFSRSGSKRVYKDQTGAQHKRLKVFDRETKFSVIIGDPEPEEVERLFEVFLGILEPGLDIDGNYTYANVLDAEWVVDEDSILRSKIAVNVTIQFSGGIYRDSDYAHIRRVEIVGVQKED